MPFCDTLSRLRDYEDRLSLLRCRKGMATRKPRLKYVILRLLKPRAGLRDTYVRFQSGTPVHPRKSPLTSIKAPLYPPPLPLQLRFVSDE